MNEGSARVGNYEVLRDVCGLQHLSNTSILFISSLGVLACRVVSAHSYGQAELESVLPSWSILRRQPIFCNESNDEMLRVVKMMVWWRRRRS